MKRPELLAPAGNLEKLKMAFAYGADAAYIGGKSFSLRARASNFTLEDIEQAVSYAHERGRRIYVTVNVLPHPEDLKHFEAYIEQLEALGVDALICASFAVAQKIRHLTALPFHISTQQSLTNSEAVRFWEAHGAKRVILARELDLESIRRIKAKTRMSLEVFIHGGMCVAFSGRCTLSNTMTGRDANRGGCAHSCRWEYDLYSDGVRLNRSQPFLMGSKDLAALPHLPALIEAGVDSVKIEGRMKSLHYIATIVNTYRRLIDDVCRGETVDIEAYRSMLSKAMNREVGPGFLGGDPLGKQQLYNIDRQRPTQDFAALVLEYDEDSGLALIEQRNHFTAGDILERFSPEGEPATFKPLAMWDEEGRSVQTARHPQQRITLKSPVALKPYDILRKAG